MKCGTVSFAQLGITKRWDAEYNLSVADKLGGKEPTPGNVRAAMATIRADDEALKAEANKLRANARKLTDNARELEAKASLTFPLRSKL